MSSIHGKLKGKKWSVWTEELGPGSPPGDTGRGGHSRPASPVPPTGDVMKLPREDMHSYGECPLWDRFILVNCEKCSRKVKIESLESHLTLRHGSKSERNAYHKVLAAKTAAALQACQINLAPTQRGLERDEKKPYADTPDVLVSGSSSSTSPLPVSYPSTPPHLTFRVSSPSPLPTPTPPLSAPSIQPADSASAPDTRSPTPDGSRQEDMDVDNTDIQEDNDVDIIPDLQSSNSFKENQEPPNLSAAAAGLNYVGEADSTTHNVISIPDSDEIPNIEIGIISEGEVMDSINTKFNVSILKTDSSVDSTTNLPKAGARHLHQLGNQTKNIQSVPVTVSNTKSPLMSPAPISMSTPPRVVAQPPPPVFQQQHHQTSSLLKQPEKQDDLASAPTHYITVSPLSKGSPKKPVVIKTGLEKKATGREREYDPNKHCGVWDADAKRNCTRSLTCKSHSVYLKRKVINRSGPFDELLATHKAEKEAAARLAESSEVEPTSILARRLQLAPATQAKVWEQTDSAKQSSVLKPGINKRNFISQANPIKDSYCDENLHYTTDHPKPLAVCTFGGKRIGGLFIADRSRFLPRKVMKIAIASTNIHRLQPVLKQDQMKRVGGLITSPATARPQQSVPYIVNLQGSNPVTRVGISTSPRVGTLQLGTGALQTQHFLVQDAFNSEIQNLKGGIKFELGRNMHQILPSTDNTGQRS